MTQRDDLDQIMRLAKTDLVEAGEKLLALVRRERPDQGALTINEYRMVQRWWDNDFDDEQTRLTSKETVDLLNGWFKLDRQNNG